MKGLALVPHSRTKIGEAELEAAVQVMRSGIINDSHVREEFEASMSEYLGRRYAWATSSGTFALHLSLLLLGIKRSDEVIIPTYVCDDVLAAVLQVGATPVPADFHPDDFNIDPDDIRRRVTRHTKAIIVAHMFGLPARLESLLHLEIPVIEDCAHAIGASCDGKLAGTLTDVAVLSFHALKMLTTGEGGMVVTDSDRLRERKRSFDCADFSIGEYNLHFHLSNILAAIGIAQLREYQLALRRRRYIADLYSRRLNGISGARLPIVDDTVRKSACFRFCLLLNAPLSYEDVERAFLAEKIVVRRPVKQLLHRSLGLTTKSFPATEAHFDRILSIPFYPDLCSEEVERVIEAVHKILG